MKKTAMQLLIEDVKRMEQGLDVEELSAYVYKRAIELLEKESEQIEEAYDEGYKDAEADMQQDKQNCGFCVNKNHYI